MEHKSWGIPINEISDIRKNEYSWNTEQFLREESERLEEESAYKKLLSVRLLDLRKYMQLGMRNIGNFWVDRIEAEYRCHLVRGHGDSYERISLWEEESGFIFSDRHLPFFDTGLTMGEGHVDWEMAIREKYVKMLGGPLPESFFRIPENLCLCTNVDIGEIGHFDMSSFNVLQDYADAHGYRSPEGSVVRGRMLGRGYEGGKFRRIVRLCLPIL